MKRKFINHKSESIHTLIREFAHAQLDDVLAKLKTEKTGLSKEEAEARYHDFGPNKLSEGYRDSLWSRLFEAIINPFNIILMLIAVVTLITDVIIATKSDYITFIVIIVLVAVSSGISFFQAQVASHAVAQLTNQISNTCHVYREGELVEINQDEVVLGDIVHLSAGDMLPADLRFIQTKDSFLAQSALTGESTPVEKFSHEIGDEQVALSDLLNIGFMGSNMVSGSARGVVFATGDSSYLGSMAQSLRGSRAKNSFERGVSDISKMLIRFMLIMVPIVLLINIFNKGDLSMSLVFAVSVAVGLTPEMLPVITTSSLAIGAQRMAKNKVITRNISAIQSFGEIDILCTDKTGTLTEDEIILERYMDLHGNDDRRVLRHAYVNSSFQTGLKNLIDVAIICRAEKYELTNLLDKYRLVDEVPFDFNRRRMSVVLEDATGKRQLITKGAVEEMMRISSFVELDGKVQPLDEASIKIARETYEKYNKEGLRMIAVAQKNDVPDTKHFSINDESHMVLLGFMGFLDPPKASSTPAIQALAEHKIRTVVLTGDSEGVAIKVCDAVGIDTRVVYTGNDVERMNDAELSKAVEVCHLFAKLSPDQKTRVVVSYQNNGHTVGFLGDGINDAPAIRQADVGISVDTAVDIAKETADIVLMEKDLMVLERGVLEGRKTFGNIIKYIKMATSGNFGNIFSIIIASLILPFLPMLPIQLLTQNLLNDFAQLGMPFDKVDKEYSDEPKSWNTKAVKRFMFWLGPVSSMFDVLCFGVLWFILGANRIEKAALFHAGWFLFGTLSQILIIHMIRTEKLPFIKSMASRQLIFTSALVAVITILIAFSGLAVGLDMVPLPVLFLPWLVFLLSAYMLVVQVVKRIYIKKYGEWI